MIPFKIHNKCCTISAKDYKYYEISSVIKSYAGLQVTQKDPFRKDGCWFNREINRGISLNETQIFFLKISKQDSRHQFYYDFF